MSIAEELQSVLDLTDADMAEVLGRSRRTSRLLRRATEILGSEDKAAWWMTEPNAALDGRTPFDVALTAPGAVLVNHLLAGLEHGFAA